LVSCSDITQSQLTKQFLEPASPATITGLVDILKT